jgi:hypothetical protein
MKPLVILHEIENNRKGAGSPGKIILKLKTKTKEIPIKIDEMINTE